MQKAFEDIVERLEEKRAELESICAECKKITVKMQYQNLGYHAAISHAEQIVNQVAEEYKSNDGWIPCSERLPEIYETVLVCNKDGRVFIRCINWISNGKSKIPYWSKNSSGIIAWRELPRPYQPKGE